MEISVRPPVQGEGSKGFRPGTVITRCWRRYIILAPAWDSRTCKGPVFWLLPPCCRCGPKSFLRALSCRDLSSVDWYGRGGDRRAAYLFAGDQCISGAQRRLCGPVPLQKGPSRQWSRAFAGPVPGPSLDSSDPSGGSGPWTGGLCDNNPLIRGGALVRPS